MNQRYSRVKTASEDWIRKLEKLQSWQLIEIPWNIPLGDMPGDKIEINEEHIKKANVIFSELTDMLGEILKKNLYGRAVLTVCGGSGVGKSEIASLLAFFLNQSGIGSYTLSGDNYPYRIPEYNDAERMRIFRECGIRGMIEDGEFLPERFELVQQWQQNDNDADLSYAKEEAWYDSYIKAGKKGLESYLGTEKEIDFKTLEQIVSAFKDGADKLWLRRIGREKTELWYEEVDFSDVQILIIEWTHGNSDNYQGIDIPILLNSTPQETLAHRKIRKRDAQTDSAFTKLVLEIEQEMLISQAKKAKIILSQNGDLMTYDDYCKLTGRREPVLNEEKICG